MTQPLRPGPYNDYSGLVRDVLGDEYAVVYAVWQQIPKLRELVKQATDTANTDIPEATQKAMQQLSSDLDSLKKQTDDYFQCEKNKIEQDTQQINTASREGLIKLSQELLDNLRKASASLEDSISKTVDDASDSMKDKLSQVTASDVEQKLKPVIDKLYEMQSSFQIMNWSSPDGTLTNAPTPQDPDAPALLFVSGRSGSPDSIFSVYVWDTKNHQWRGPSFTMNQPAPSPAGTGFYQLPDWGSSAPTAATRPNGEPWRVGDTVVNAATGDSWVRQSDGTWKQGGSLKGPQGSTTVTGIDFFSDSGNAVTLVTTMRWDGGSHNIETLKWPFGFIFKNPPLARFSAFTAPADNSGGANTPVDPTTKKDDQNYPAVYDQTVSGFTYRHTGAWPGSQNEILELEVTGEPDYPSMAAQGWKPDDTLKNQMRSRGIGRIELYISRASIPAENAILDGTSFDPAQNPEYYALTGATAYFDARGLFPRAKGDSAALWDWDGAQRSQNDGPTVQKPTLFFGAYESQPAVVPDLIPITFFGKTNWVGIDPLRGTDSSAIGQGQVGYFSQTGQTKLADGHDTLFGGQGNYNQTIGTMRPANFDVFFTVVTKSVKGTYRE